MEVLVTRKDQVTVPVKLRRKSKIVEVMKLTVEESPLGIVFKVIPKIEDLTGEDAQTITIEKANSQKNLSSATEKITDA